MDFDKLPEPYWNSQIERVKKALEIIAERGQSSVPSKVLPENEDLILGTGRRLSMAVMFLDICDFSSRPSESQEEQEYILRTLNLFFTEMIKIAEDYGGTIEKNTGDGLMVYFEDTNADFPESGCKRAIACALTMFYVTRNLINPLIVRNSGQEIHFRIGIDHGMVTIANIGAAKRFGSLVAIGATANVASKIIPHAGKDEIIIGEQVKNKLPDNLKQYCAIHTINTGWNYILTGLPYYFYKFDAHWVRPM